MSRKKRILQALGLEDEFNELFGVRPRARPRAPRAVPSQNPFAVKLERAAQQAQRALPAPPKPLALPAPGPGLPPKASKPRGGQFWTSKVDPESSPDDVASRQAADLGYRFLEWQPDDDYGLISLQVPDIPKEQFAVQDWLARSLAKYYKTDFGAPDDPLRDLAARGLHYDVDMTPERWKATVDSYLIEDPIEQILFPPNRLGGMPGAGSDLRGQTLAAMPWLAKQPVTDKVYGIMGGGLDLEHFADELANALNPEASGLPADLALRPESLARMSFPQAVERVGRINQFRVKQMEDAAQALANNPAVQTFKEYPDAGYRWVELRAPEYQLPEGYTIGHDRIDGEDGPIDWYQVLDAEGNSVGGGGDEAEALKMAFSFTERDPRNALQDALKYEGDTMGHCVGGYCDDVLSGRSRIFSLRDAKGQPHVTIETSPGAPRTALADIPREALDEIAAAAKADTDQVAGPLGIDMSDPRWARTYQTNLALKQREWLAANPTPQNIIQIKGKQNRAPVEDYLPYVQDFVKSGTWGNIGDLGNTGLVQLPDGRFITQQQYDDARARAISELLPGQVAMSRGYDGRINADNWDNVAPYFEGFAIGGRVDADRCFSRSPFGVRR